MAFYQHLRSVFVTHAIRDITTLDPLNLALAAKTRRSRIMWWLVTVSALALTIALVAALMIKFRSRETIVVTKFKRNDSPFPAITFCNMNPYKKSALASMPEVAELVRLYSTASAPFPNATKEDSKRSKRSGDTVEAASASCSCTYSNVTDAVFANSVYQRFSDGKISRTAKIDNGALIGYLRRAGIITDIPAWIGLHGIQGGYFWYSGPETPLENATDMSALCDTCQTGSGWKTGGSVVVSVQNDTVIFDTERIGSFQEVICEYYDLSTTIDVEKAAIEASTSFTTTEPAVAEELATSMDTKGEKVQELGMTKQNGNEDPTPDFQTRTTSSSRTKPHVVLNGKRISASTRTESVTPKPVAKAVPSGRRNNASEPNHVYHYIDDELNNVRSDASALSVTSEDILAYLASSLSRGAAVHAGYTIAELLISCVFNGIQCNAGDFELTPDPSYGNCYTFNADGRFATSPQPGVARGLSVTYFIGANQYLDFIQTAGIRLVIHRQNHTVLPDSSGINLPNGYQCSASIKQSRTISVTTGSDPCVNSIHDVPIFNYVNSSYSVEACLRSCYQDSVIKRCQCGDPRVPLPPDSKVNHCDVLRRNCVNTFYAVAKEEEKCHCPPECRSDIYDTTVTLTKWSRKHTVEHELHTNGSLASSRIQLARVEIYFEDATIVEYTETLAYDVFAVIWDISCILGLVLGASVLSTFEVAHLARYVWNNDDLWPDDLTDRCSCCGCDWVLSD